MEPNSVFCSAIAEISFFENVSSVVSYLLSGLFKKSQRFSFPQDTVLSTSSPRITTKSVERVLQRHLLLGTGNIDEPLIKLSLKRVFPIVSGITNCINGF